MPAADKVRIVEVGARDGLQNETHILDAATKAKLIEDLVDCGITHVEVGSFVSPKWVPTMANTAEVFDQLARKAGIVYAALAPNLKGLGGALASNASEVAIFTAASDAFTQKNINCSIEESLEKTRAIVDQAKAHQLPVRAYVSCVMGCPYQGDVSVDDVIRVSRALLDIGCYEISLGDTIGVGTPKQTKELIQALGQELPLQQLAMHFHDTYGQALANIHTGLELGISTIDSAVAGLGGCPYAKGASGNVATEDVVYMLEGLGVETGIDLSRLSQTGQWISDVLSHPNGSKAGAATYAKQTR